MGKVWNQEMWLGCLFRPISISAPLVWSCVWRFEDMQGQNVSANMMMMIIIIIIIIIILLEVGNMLPDGNKAAVLNLVSIQTWSAQAEAKGRCRFLSGLFQKTFPSKPPEFPRVPQSSWTWIKPLHQALCKSNLLLSSFSQQRLLKVALSFHVCNCW